MNRLQNKIALVTGTSTGIGWSIAQRFAAEGATVLAASRRGTVEDTASGQIIPYQADISDPDQVRDMVRYCREKFGRLDILCNNAGIAHAGARIHELPLEDWDRVMNTNLRGAFLVLKYCLALMVENPDGGAVVNMGSLGSIRGTPGSTAYITSKTAIHGLTRQAALEYASDNIRVNTVAPAVTLTPLVAQAPEEVIRPLLARMPLGRACTPEEVAALSAFLVSSEANTVTGSLYLMDGGWSAA